MLERYLETGKGVIINAFFCRNPAFPNDGLQPPQSCMSRGGIPVQPYFVLGGFGEVEVGQEPEYEKATAVVITLLVDNYNVDKK